MAWSPSVLGGPSLGPLRRDDDINAPERAFATPLHPETLERVEASAWVTAIGTAVVAVATVVSVVSSIRSRGSADQAAKSERTVTTSVKTARRAAVAATLQHLSDLYHVNASAKQQEDGSWLVTVDPWSGPQADAFRTDFQATLPDETFHFVKP